MRLSKHLPFFCTPFCWRCQAYGKALQIETPNPVAPDKLALLREGGDWKIVFEATG